MSRRILILDDEPDFTSLLSDVFSQAGHEISAEHHPKKALKAIDGFKPDLIVTDHGLPGMNGREFLTGLRKAAKDQPVVVVSGNLDNHAIRDYINAGVCGVFLKPLNIFSLLKRIEAVLDERDKATAVATGGSGDGAAVPQGEWVSQAFAGIEKKSRAFLQRLKALQNFKSNLLLVGRPGTDYVSIGYDLCSLAGQEDRLLVFDEKHLTEEALLEATGSLAGEGITRVTGLIPDMSMLDGDRQKLLFTLAKKTGPFAGLDVTARFIFCLNDDLESLYEAGKVDDSLYMFLGTCEIKVPRLSDCPRDLGVMARRFLGRLTKENRWGHVPSFDESAEAFFRSHSWDGEHEEFYLAISNAAKAGPEAVITAEILRGTATSTSQAPDIHDQGLEAYLSAARDEVAHAAAILAEGNLGLAAEVLAVREQFFQAGSVNR